MNNPKELIIEEYKKRGVPISLEDLFLLHKEKLLGVNRTLSEIPLLQRMFDLSPEQTSELIKFYGKGFLFSEEIEKSASDYAATREKIDLLEKKRGK